MESAVTAHAKGTVYITQIRPNDQNKQTKARESLKAKKAVILVLQTVF